MSSNYFISATPRGTPISPTSVRLVCLDFYNISDELVAKKILRQTEFKSIEREKRDVEPSFDYDYLYDNDVNSHSEVIK